MTCSFHKFGEYFPGTGTQEDKGRAKGKGYALNVPLKDGITDESLKSVFEPVSPVNPTFWKTYNDDDFIGNCQDPRRVSTFGSRTSVWC